MTRRDLLSLLVVAAGLVAGALREFIFVNLNYQLDFQLNQRPANYAHTAFQAWAAGLDAAALTRAKWILALGFVGAMLGLTLLLARLRLGDHRYARAIAIGYAALGAAALLLHLGSAPATALRAVSIEVLHALQYPVPLLLVWVLSWFGPMGDRPERIAGR